METSVEMLDCQNLTPGSLVDVETKSRHYKIEWLGGNKIRISGHPEYCPEPMSAWLEGSIAGDGTLDFGLIERGQRMMFLLGDRPVRTSPVLHVHVAQTAEAAPESAPSIR